MGNAHRNINKLSQYFSWNLALFFSHVPLYPGIIFQKRISGTEWFVAEMVALAGYLETLYM